MLEWEVEILPLSQESNLQPGAAGYGPDFITSNCILPGDRPDLSVLPGKDVLIKAANVYSGSSILTPYASSPAFQSYISYAVSTLQGSKPAALSSTLEGFASETTAALQAVKSDKLLVYTGERAMILPDNWTLMALYSSSGFDLLQKTII